MISATALNSSTVPLNKSPQMPLGLENSRLRVDSQKFLVPSLPVSSRQLNPRADPHNQAHHHTNPLHYQQQQQHNGSSNAMDIKRRSIHPISPGESSRMAAGMPSSVHGGLNGLHRRSTSPLSSKGTSPNYAHMQNSPRKDAHSPMYAGEVPGFSGSPGSSYSARSSVPIPCSSPSPGTSASPKSSASHSLSPSSPYPHLPPGLNPAANGASELSQLAVAAAAAAAASGNRLYPAGFPPPSAAAAHHAAFYAAAAAAAGHSLPYPSLFGSPYPPHQHPASSYLDFHSKLLRNSSELRSSSQSPPSRSYQAAVSPQQSHNIIQPLGSPQSTSVTSLHTKLIESVSAAGDRFHPHHHTSHNHVQTNNQQAHASRFSSSPSASASSSGGSGGVSKGGPLGISGGIMGLTIAPNSSSPHKGHSGPTSATPEMSGKSMKLYMEHPGLPGNESSRANHERKLLAEMELMNGSKATKEAIMLAKQRMMSRSPEDFSLSRNHQQEHQNSQKKSISFAADVHSGGIHRPSPHSSLINGHVPHHAQQQHYHHSQGHLHQQHSPSSSGPTNLSVDCKKGNAPGSHTGNNTFPQQHHMFLPPSPKKRSAHWNFAVPQSPLNAGAGGGRDLLPPPPPPSSSDSLADQSIPTNLHLSPSSKYLSQNQHNQKPSNGGPAAAGVSAGGVAPGATGSHYQSTNAQQLLVVPNSPLSSSSSSHGGSAPTTPKSPSVHFRFFGGVNNKENNGVATNASARSGRVLNARNDSSSSTSSIELGVINGNGRKNNGHCGPWPVEQMPLITAFRKGSMIKLASGELKAVEELTEDDFEKAVMMTDSVRIVYCHVIAIQAIPDSSLCKVTLAMGSAHNQQVIVESSPEQPFFIRGRGWSSSAPKLTEKLLQLPCTTLAVGDICITLTRQNVRNQINSASSGGPGTSSSGRGSKSKSGVTRPYGTYAKSRNSSTSSILKSSHQPQQRANNAGGVRINARKSVSGLTSIPGATNMDVSTSSNSVGNFGINNNPTSPSIRQPEKPPQSVVHHSYKEVEQQDKSAEKEVDLSVAKTDSSATNAATPASTTMNTCEKKSMNSNEKGESDHKKSMATSIITAEARYKRKSISPVPLGYQGNKGNADDQDNVMRPPSPKKRRWSAPEQIEVDSQQTNVLFTKNKEPEHNAETSNVSESRGESEFQYSSTTTANSSMNENSKVSDNAEGINSVNEMTSLDISPEKA